MSNGGVGFSIESRSQEPLGAVDAWEIRCTAPQNETMVENMTFAAVFAGEFSGSLNGGAKWISSIQSETMGTSEMAAFFLESP